MRPDINTANLAFLNKINKAVYSAKIANERNAPTANEYVVFMLKEAASGSIDLPHLAALGKKLVESPFAKGTMYAAGASIPVYFTGKALTEHAAEEARNKALQTAAGVAAIGSGLYGLHHAINGSPKQASFNTNPDLHDSIEKLASAILLSDLLKTKSIQHTLGEKTAGDIENINNAYVVDILSSLLN